MISRKGAQSSLLAVFLSQGGREILPVKRRLSNHSSRGGVAFCAGLRGFEYPPNAPWSFWDLLGCFGLLAAKFACLGFYHCWTQAHGKPKAVGYISIGGTALRPTMLRTSLPALVSIIVSASRPWKVQGRQTCKFAGLGFYQCWSSNRPWSLWYILGYLHPAMTAPK